MRLFKFIELFKLSIKNNFYKKGYSSDFVIEPSQHCRKLLKNHRLKTKTTPYGLTVFGEVEQDGNDNMLFSGFKSDTKFTFLMKLRNPFFINFTDVPVKTERHGIYYFNNQANHELDGELFLVNKEEIPKTVSNSTRIRLFQEVYNYTYTGSGDEKTGTLSFVGEGLSINQTVNSNEGDFRFQFDLSQYNPGRCRFSVEEKTENFYAANDIYREDVFGIIEIFVNSSVPVNYQFVDTDNVVAAREYAIPFTNRCTIWRYLVYDKQTNTLNKPKVTASGVKFKRRKIPTGNYPEDFTLYTFTSGEEGSSGIEKTLPLKEEPIKNIKLSGRINGSKKDIIEHLPNPDITLIKPDTTDTSKIYSDIIIYV